MSATVIETKIKAINSSQREFKQLHADLKKTQTEGRKATTVWDRFGKAGEGAAGKAGIFGQALAGINPVGLAVGATLGAITTTLVSGTMSMAEWEKRLGRTEALLKSTGYAAGLTALELDNLARERDLSTLGDRNEIMDSINVMQTFKSVSGDTFRESIKLAQDMSVVTGQSLTSATTMLGKALEDPIKGLNSMRRVGVSFTETEQEVIKTMAEANDVAGAQSKIMEVLRGQFAGAAEGEAVALLGALDTLSYEWRDLLESMEQTDAAVDGVNALVSVIKDLQFAIRDTFGEFSLEDQASQLESAIATVKRSMETMRDEAVELPVLDAWIGKSAHLEAAQEKLDALESQLHRIRALQEGKDIRDTFVIHDKGKAAAASRAKDYMILDQVEKDKAEEDVRKAREKESAAAAKKAAADKVRAEKRAASKLESEEKARSKRLARFREQLDEARLGKEYVERQRIEATYNQMRADGIGAVEADFWKGKQMDELTQKMLEDIDQWKLAFGEFGTEAEDVFGVFKQEAFSAFSTGDAMLDKFLSKWMDLALFDPMQNLMFSSGGGSGFDFMSFGSSLGGSAMDLFSSIFHDGGIVGGPAPARMVPADLFKGAPRFHSGGLIGDEVAIIGKPGEEVLTEDNPRHIRNFQGGGTNVSVPIELVVYKSGKDETTAQSQASPDGMRQIMLAIGNDITQGGPVMQSIERNTTAKRRVP